MITMDIRKRHIVRTLRAAVLLLFVSAFLSRCASMMTPTGGPRDSLPPVIVNMTPDNFSTNHQTDKRAERQAGGTVFNTKRAVLFMVNSSLSGAAYKRSGGGGISAAMHRLFQNVPDSGDPPPLCGYYTRFSRCLQSFFPVLPQRISGFPRNDSD